MEQTPSSVPLLEHRMVRDASMLAAHHHRSQIRRYNGVPYFTHLKRVAEATAKLSAATPEMVAAAFLHDLLEDQAPTAEERPRLERYILNDTGAITLRYVIGLTNPSKGSNLPRAERKKMDREHLAKQEVEVRRIKLVDRIDNLAETFHSDMIGLATDFEFQNTYIDESLALMEALRGTDKDLENRLGDIADLLSEWIDRR